MERAASQLLHFLAEFPHIESCVVEVQVHQQMRDAVVSLLKLFIVYESRNIRLDVRWASNQAADVERLAAELAALKPDVILANGTPSVVVLKKITASMPPPAIPVVCALVQDPVGLGLVASLARPGGNITGFTQLLPGDVIATGTPGGVGLPQSPFSAAALSTPRCFGKSFIIARRNSSESLPAARASSSTKHSMYTPFWFVLTPRHGPTGTWVLRIEYSISRFLKS